MKIVVIVASFDLTGVPLAQLRLAGALAAKGFHVEFVVGAIQPGVMVEPPAGVRLHVLGASQARRLVMPIVRYLRRVRPDIVFTAQDHLNAVVALAATLARSRARITASSRITPFDAYSGKPFSKRWLMKYAIKLAWRRIDVLTCVSQGMVAEYRQLFPGARHVCVYNIIDDAAIAERDRPDTSTDVPLPSVDSARLLVSAGYLAPWKGFDVLLRAVALIPRELGVHLAILGDGPQRHELENLATMLDVNDRITFTGYVANPVRYYRSASVFVHAARREAFGNVLVEAMLCNCTVVATDCPTGPREILGEGRYGYVVPMEDPQALARGIRQALLHPVAPEILAEGVRPFHQDIVIRRHFDLLGIAA